MGLGLDQWVSPWDLQERKSAGAPLAHGGVYLVLTPGALSSLTSEWCKPVSLRSMSYHIPFGHSLPFKLVESVSLFASKERCLLNMYALFCNLKNCL